MLALLLGLAAMAPPAIVAPTPLLRPAPPVYPAPPAPPARLLSEHPQYGATNVMRLFSTDDYPMEAIRREEQGTVSYRATVGIDGRVSACAITSSSGSIHLDAATCNIIRRRARFRPALDHQGRPTEDKFSGRIRWVLPKLDPTPFADQRNLAIFTIDDAGLVVNCRLEGAEPGAFDQRICPALLPVARQIAAGIKPTMADSGQELVLEQGVLIGGPDSADFIGQGSGERLIKRAAFALTIDGLGKVIDCVAVGYGVEVGDAANACALDRKRGFSPLEADAANQTSRHAVRYMATYTRSQQ